MALTSSDFQCSVITPEAVVLETEASAASFPAHDGEFGILRDRAPLVCKLGIGVMRLETAEGPRKLFLDGGFAEVHANRLTILTNRALRSDEVDAETARRELDEATGMRITDEASLQARQDGIARGKVLLSMVSRG